ncbi:MAG: LytTR family DNA-binding domain-containing protein [Carboxylicivirga sp.]|jgi:two-component system LytT family response regulator|nr:LytTR family DNA-binding domain-containing protein [Carboxylicivirga sp.]
MRGIIIDDEMDAISGLEKLIKEFIDINVSIVGTAKNLEDGIKLINSEFPDIVFLDIEMPNQNGLSIYKTFPNPDFEIIFTTAYNQYAIDAIKKNAADYLLKPVIYKELSEAVEKVKARIDEKQQKLNLENHFRDANPVAIHGKDIMFSLSDGFEIINTKEIEYCIADQSYSEVVLFDGKKLTISKPLKDLELMLPEEQFYRTHKSFLVNIHYIRKFIKGQQSNVILRSGKKIPVSVRIVPEFILDIKRLFNK